MTSPIKRVQNYEDKVCYTYPKLPNIACFDAQWKWRIKKACVKKKLHIFNLNTANVFDIWCNSLDMFLLLFNWGKHWEIYVIGWMGKKFQSKLRPVVEIWWNSFWQTRTKKLKHSSRLHPLTEDLKQYRHFSLREARLVHI